MKNILITGASRGIGKATSIYLAEQGYRVILVSRNESNLKEVANEIGENAYIYPYDLMDLEYISQIYDFISDKGMKLDGMVHCAGVCFVKPAKLTTIKELRDMYTLNVFSFYELCRHFVKTKYSNKSSSIVGISSYASISRESGMSAYAMSKESVNVMVQILAKEYAKRRIRVNAVLPARVQSRMASESNEWSEDELADIIKIQSFGVIPIKQVVNSIEFLLSENSAFITGALLPIGANFHN